MAMEIDEFLKERGKRVFKSSLVAVNDVFDGEPYTSSEVFVVYGKPQVGKSLFVLQEAVYLESLGYKVLMIDTEGSLRGFASQWLPILRSRFEGGKRGKIFATEKKTLQTLLRYMGWEVTVSSKGSKDNPKIEFNIVREVERELEKFVKGKGVDMVVIDSVTAPIREAIPSAQQNHPAKADATRLLMGSLLALQEETDVAVVATAHASFNPANPYDTTAKMRGGVAMYHYAKHIVYLDKRESRDMRGVRRFWLVRAPGAEEWSRVGVARITDVGYVDVEGDVRDYLTDSERRRLRA